MPEAGIVTWHDIARLDVRPDKGIVKVRAKNSWEIQLDFNTGELLQVAYRRSDFFESLHDGTYFQEKANLWLMLPSAVCLLVLWATGLYLFVFPYIKSANRKLGRVIKFKPRQSSCTAAPSGEARREA
ncbi:MAG: hypothetical protein HOC23_10055 [Halieaceae bacterium]|nr:hypothetical protein [Halieaceae bacterium]